MPLVSLDEVRILLRLRGLDLSGPPGSSDPLDGWATCTNPREMLMVFGWLPAKHRKRRLFACACARALEPLLTDERSRRAVQVAERYADGQVRLEEMRAARIEAFRATRGA